MSSTHHELWCLLEGDKIPFSVNAPSTITIDELKIMIKERIQTDLVAYRLVLWKPRDVILVMPSNTLAQRLGDLGLVYLQFAEELDPADTVAYSFRTQIPTSPHLDVIVQVSTSTPQDPLADDFESSWLEEVRSKIWHKNELELDLFRKVEVTQAHYVELEKRLKEQLPDRDLPEYDGQKHNVQSVKLDVLAKTFSPRHPDNNENRADFDIDPEAPPSNEDGYEMDSDESEMDSDVDDLEASNEDGSAGDSLFPFTLSFLDFSTLGLKESMPNRFPLLLLIRQEYDHISTLIKTLPQNSQGSVIISGQPGTGKTSYLYLGIIQSMIEGRPFLYQAKNGIVYHVNENGVEVIRSWSSTEETVAFVDGYKDNMPDHMLIRESVQFILTSSPRGASAKWVEQMGCVDVLTTKLWSPRELFLTGIFLYPFDISLKLLRESTSYLGYNPRLCFNSAYSVDVLKGTKEVVMSQIRDVAINESKISQLLHSSRMGDSDVSHAIFVISPQTKSRHPAQCKFGAVSRWALDLLLKEYETRWDNAVAAFYDYISGMSDTASLRGPVFERQVLNYLNGMDAEHKFSIRGLTSEQMTWSYRGPIRRFNFLQDLDFIDEITKAVQSRNPLHLVPLALNFPVNSILYDPNEALTCIQITISRKHHILVSGLQRIRSWLKRDTRLAGLLPLEERPWRFIFIVPSDEASFEMQRLEGDTQGEWAGKVQQYVLGLDVVGKKE